MFICSMYVSVWVYASSLVLILWVKIPADAQQPDSEVKHFRACFHWFIAPGRAPSPSACVCVCERVCEREWQRQWYRQKLRQKARVCVRLHPKVCACVCVSVLACLSTPGAIAPNSASGQPVFPGWGHSDCGSGVHRRDTERKNKRHAWSQHWNAFEKHGEISVGARRDEGVSKKM